MTWPQDAEGFDNQRASFEEAKGNKRKQNGFLLFPFISFYFLLFLRIGTFQ